MGKIKNLKDLRKSKGISQKYICEAFLYSRPTVHAKETKKSPVSVSEAIMFANIFNEDVEYIKQLCRVK